MKAISISPKWCKIRNATIKSRPTFEIERLLLIHCAVNSNNSVHAHIYRSDVPLEERQSADRKHCRRKSIVSPSSIVHLTSFSNIDQEASLADGYQRQEK